MKTQLNKIFLALLFLLPVTSWSKSLKLAEFKLLPLTSQVAILSAYTGFVRDYLPSGYAPEEKLGRIQFFSIINEAYAAGNFDCFFAGWPSVKKEIASGNGKKSVCSSPARENPDYQKLSKACGADSMLCQPALFGHNLCVSTATQKQKNLAFAQCEQKFKESGKTLEAQAKEIAAGSFAQETADLFSLVDFVCREGFQAQTAMCRNLEKKVADLRKLTLANDVAKEKEIIQEAVAQTVALENITNMVDAEIKCDTCEEAKRQVSSVPTPVASPKRSESYTPQQGLIDLNASKLTFVGRVLLKGSGQNRTCIFKNDRVYVLYNHCMANRKEAPAFAMEIISLEGDMVSFYAEPYSDTRVSKTPRENYTGTWSVSVRQTNPPGQLNGEGIIKYMDDLQSDMKGGCYIGNMGGAQDMSSKVNCYSGYTDDKWKKDGEDFWRDPGVGWQPMQSKMRQLVETVPF